MLIGKKKNILFIIYVLGIGETWIQNTENESQEGDDDSRETIPSGLDKLPTDRD